MGVGRGGECPPQHHGLQSYCLGWDRIGVFVSCLGLDKFGVTCGQAASARPMLAHKVGKPLLFTVCMHKDEDSQSVTWQAGHAGCHQTAGQVDKIIQAAQPSHRLVLRLSGLTNLVCCVMTV